MADPDYGARIAKLLAANKVSGACLLLDGGHCSTEQEPVCKAEHAWSLLAVVCNEHA